MARVIQTVGVVTIQGDYEKHISAFLSFPDVGAVRVRTPDDLLRVDRLVIPGGESSTVGILMERFGLGQAIQDRAGQGMPVWGTCMGMILLAKRVDGPAQYNLGLLDILVERNAFGAQVHSFEEPVKMEGFETAMPGVFIRAPVVREWGASVTVLGRVRGEVVAVRDGNLLGTSFHPELTDDLRLHEWFLTW